MTFDEIDYFRRREQQERTSAKAATSLAARRAHQQMAQVYAGLLAGAESFDTVPGLRRCGAL